MNSAQVIKKLSHCSKRFPNYMHMYKPLGTKTKQAKIVGLEEVFQLHLNTPNANMADHSVVARDELHESEVSQCLMFC